MNSTGSLTGTTAESGVDVAKILEDAKIRRTTEAERRKIISEFRRAAEPNVGTAIMYFVLAVSQGATCAMVYSTGPGIQRPNHWPVEMSFSIGLAVYFFVLGMRKICLTPRDRYLLLLADELEKKNAG